MPAESTTGSGVGQEAGDRPVRSHARATGTARTVLLTSGLNPVARAFVTMPGTPAGIVQIRSGEPESATRQRLRRVVRRLQGEPVADLDALCARHELAFFSLHKSDHDGLRDVLARLEADLVVSCSCPLLAVRSLAGLSIGAINLHDALLPAYRGGNPLFWQVFDQVDEVGVSVHFIDAGIDTGPLLGQRHIARPRAVSRRELQRLLESSLGIPLLEETMVSLMEGRALPDPQVGKSTTRAARHLNTAALKALLDDSPPSLDALWDLACYWEHWPAELGEYRGWRRWFRWVPDSLERRKDPAAPGGRWEACPGGLTRMYIPHAAGRLWLVPRLPLGAFR